MARVRNGQGRERAELPRCTGARCRGEEGNVVALGSGAERPDLVVPGFLLGLAGVLVEAGPHADSLRSGLGDYFFFAALLSGGIAVVLFSGQLVIPRLRSVLRGLRRIVGFVSTIVAVSLIVSISCSACITRQ